MKHLPKVSRRKIGRKPQHSPLKSCYAKAVHELMLEEDRAWARMVQKEFPDLAVPKHLTDTPAPAARTPAQIFDRKKAPRVSALDRITIERQPVRMIEFPKERQLPFRVFQDGNRIIVESVGKKNEAV